MKKAQCNEDNVTSNELASLWHETLHCLSITDHQLVKIRRTMQSVQVDY